MPDKLTNLVAYDKLLCAVGLAHDCLKTGARFAKYLTIHRKIDLR